MSHKALYDLWRGMISRCHNPKHVSYPYYGAKGIGVCDAWRASFAAFAADVSPRPRGHTLDRPDNLKDYGPSNWRWATVREQNNNKSDTRLITFNGKTQNMSAWAKELGTSPAALHHRLAKLQLPVEVALSVPVSRRNRHHPAWVK